MQKRKNYQGAIADLNEAIRLDPDSASFYEDRATTYDNRTACPTQRPLAIRAFFVRKPPFGVTVILAESSYLVSTL
jgi:hypothetical protein